MLGSISVRRWLLVAIALLWGWFPANLIGQSSVLEWSEDGNRLCFVKQDGDGRTFVVVNIETKKSSPAFDHKAVANSLAKELGREVKPGDLPIEWFGFGESVASGESLQIQSGSRTFAVELATSQLTPVERDPKPRFFMPPRVGPQGRSTEIVIENGSDNVVQLFWVGGNSRPTSYGEIEPGGKRKQHTYAGHVWLVKIKGESKGCFEAKEGDYVLIENSTFDNVRKSTRRGRRKRADRGSRATSRFASANATSPDGKWKATVIGHDLSLASANGSDENGEKAVRLTNYGTRDWTFKAIGSGTRWRGSVDDENRRPDVRWSPESKMLVAFQTKPVPEPRVHYIESAPNNRLQPELKSYQYPKPGDDLLLQTLRLFSVADKSEIKVSNELFKNPFQTRFLGWSKSGDSFRLLYNQRGHQVLRLVEVSAKGEVRTIVEETSDTFIQYSDSGKFVLEELEDGEILWASERSGWNHLYRFDAAQGKLINAVTKGDWNVKRIEKIDREQRSILFYAVGVHQGQDPYHEHLCSVNFDGSDFKILTTGDGTHRVEFVREGEFFIDTFSRVDLAPVKELRQTKTGQLVVELERQNARRLFGDRKMTERFVAKGRDGKTDIWGIIHWPNDFDPEKKYPVVENIYAGPHDHHVPKSFRARFGHQHRISDAGMIVVQIDGMGTAWRSKAFHDVCFKNLRDAGFPDRIEWIKAAAKKHPQMDISRVGIYGGSAGGQNAMAALLWHNDFYKVAVADCGCHDNRMDKIWWNEQWMGWPVDAAYAENSNKENAKLLEGKLMLTLGELDRNVDPASTTQVIHELIKHNKDFEFVLVAGRGHGAGESPWASKKRLNFFKQHLGVE